MRKIFLLGVLSLLAFATGAQSYKADFNSTVDTSDPSFKANPGWAHLVSTGGYSYQKVTYTYVADGGVDASGCLQAGDQGYDDWWTGSTVALNDLLVTPQVGGTVTLQVKKATSTGNVKFYKVTKNGADWVMGDEITFEDPGLVSFDFTPVELTDIPEGTYIGIRAENVLIDDFTATTANVVLTRGLTIAQVTPAVDNNTIDCDENNQFTVKATVVLKNTGELDLNPGDEGYQLQIANMKPGTGADYVVDEVLVTQPVNVALAVGQESEPIEISVVLNEADVVALPGNDNKARRYDVVEGVTGTTHVIRNYQPIAYRPDASLFEGMTEYATGSTLNFGLTTGEAARTLTLYNDGAAPLQVTAVTVEGEGFATTLVAPFTVDKHSQVEVPLTMTSATPGAKTGKLTIEGTGIEPFIVNLTGEVLDPDKWYVNFEDGQLPANVLNIDSWEVSNSLVTGENKYYAVNSKNADGKLISPLLQVEDGETFGLDAARNYDTPSAVRIYYSTDRKEWTLLRTLDANAENDADRLTDTYTGYAWGSNTKYDFTRFTIDNVPAGQGYLAFEASNARIDNLLGFKVVAVEHDAFVTLANIPAAGTVNTPFNVTANLKNLTETVEAAGSYTARLYVDGAMVAEAEATELAAYGENAYSFSTLIHEQGTFEAYVEFAGEGFTATSDVVTVTIGEELATNEVQVGTNNGSDTKSAAPLTLYNNKSESETVYTAQDLGIAAGSKISRMVFKGHGTTAKSVTGTLKVWLENTEDAAPQDVLLNEDAIAAMTQVYNDSYTYDVTRDETDVLVLNLAIPFEYTGKNLRVVMHTENSGWVTCYFEHDKNVTGQSVYRSHDRTISGACIASELPVMYLTVSTEASTMAGRVTDTEGNAVAGATVTLTSRAQTAGDDAQGAPRRVSAGDQVVYTATTDAQGNYSVDVFQSGLDYDVMVTADGYKPYNGSVSFANGNVESDIVLEPEDVTAVTDITAAQADENAPIYDLMGRRLTAKPSQGIYIQNGRKHMAR